MRHSADRVLTTHAGSLPRPDALLQAWSKPTSGPRQEVELQALLRSSVSEVVEEQLKAGVDVPNDGEFGKPMRSVSDLAAWGTYIFGRLYCGLGGRVHAQIAWAKLRALVEGARIASEELWHR